MLSNDACSGSPRKSRCSLPLSADGLRCSSIWTAPNPPGSVAGLTSRVVSPVSVNANERKRVPGWKTPFSGRLNGVPPSSAFASAAALNGAVPSVAVSWSVTHFVWNVWPYSCKSCVSGELMSDDGRVGLDALVGGGADDAAQVDRRRAGVERLLPHAAAGRVALGGEEQLLGERVPGRAVEGEQRGVVVVRRRHQRHAMVAVGVEVHARDGAGRAGLVALEDEVRAVVIGGIGALLTAEDQVRVLVRLGLVGL